MIRIRTIMFLLAGVTLAQSRSANSAGNAPQPNICTRACWGASAGSTSYMSALTRAIIHHTAGSEYNTSGLEASKTNVRAIQNLHKSYGWGDIGYHFLVDKYGNIFEGRINSWSGLPRGTHDGTNTNSFGFNLMGYYHPSVNNIPTQASLNALYAVIAWRMPNGWTPYGSPGVYGPNGLNVGRLDSHRRVNATACPGDHLHNPYIGNDVNSGVMRAEVMARINGVPPAPTVTRNTNSHFQTADGRLVTFAVHTDGTIQTKSQASAGGAWGPWNLVGQGGGFTGLDVVHRSDDKFTCFGVGNGTPAWISWQDSSGNWSGWNSLGGTLSFVQGHRYNDGRYGVIACGNGSEVFSNTQVTPSGAWSGWGAIASGGGFTHVASIKRPDETFVVFGIGLNTPVWITWQNSVSGAFVPWQSLGGPGFASIRAVRRNDGSLAVFGVGNGTEVWANSQLSPGGGWGNWGVISSGGGFTRIDPVVRSNDTIAVFGCGNGTPVWVTEQYAAGGAFQGWGNMGNNGVTTCDAFITGDGKFRLFANGNGTQEWINWQDTANGPWSGWAGIGGLVW